MAAKLALAGLIALLLGGCASVRPESAREATAASYSAILTLAELVEDARDAGVIDADDVAEAKRRLQQAKDATDTAFDLISQGEDTAGQSLLDRATSILQVVEQILTEHTDGRSASNRDHQADPGSTCSSSGDGCQYAAAVGAVRAHKGRGPRPDGRGNPTADGRRPGSHRPALIAA